MRGWGSLSCPSLEDESPRASMARLRPKPYESATRPKSGLEVGWASTLTASLWVSKWSVGSKGHSNGLWQRTPMRTTLTGPRKYVIPAPGDIKLNVLPANWRSESGPGRRRTSDTGFSVPIATATTITATSSSTLLLSHQTKGEPRLPRPKDAGSYVAGQAKIATAMVIRPTIKSRVLIKTNRR